MENKTQQTTYPGVQSDLVWKIFDSVLDNALGVLKQSKKKIK